MNGEMNLRFLELQVELGKQFDEGVLNLQTPRLTLETLDINFEL
jgi:hypothetical protein